MTKEGLEPLSWQSDSLGSNDTRALRNQERTCWPPSLDSGRTLRGQRCGSDAQSIDKPRANQQGWQLLNERERMLSKQLPKSVQGKILWSPSQHPALCLALPGVCGKEQRGIEEETVMVSALQKFAITADTKPQRRFSQV